MPLYVATCKLPDGTLKILKMEAPDREALRRRLAEEGLELLAATGEGEIPPEIPYAGAEGAPASGEPWKPPVAAAPVDTPNIHRVELAFVDVRFPFRSVLIFVFQVMASILLVSLLFQLVGWLLVGTAFQFLAPVHILPSH